MNTLARQRCLNHAGREAAARCPGCRRFFCRECIAEHDGRILCTTCLGTLAASSTTHRPGSSWAPALLQFLAAIVLAWFFFFLIGAGLLVIPTSFHEGTLWRKALQPGNP